jgi:hypothetical protein
MLFRVTAKNFRSEFVADAYRPDKVHAHVERRSIETTHAADVLI